MNERSNWQTEGACTEVPLEQIDKVFFQEGRYQATVPKLVAELCGRCVVRAECLEDAVEYPPDFGYRAGIGSDDLQRMHDNNNVLPFDRQEPAAGEEVYEEQ